MRRSSRSSTRTRVQLDLKPEQLGLLESLERKLALRSRSDLIQEAIGTLAWLVQETLRGRKIVSVDPEDVDKLGRAIEMVSPSIIFARGELYEYLVSRPNRGLQQLWLKGRNLSVGQLIALMRANGLGPEDAAEDLNLPAAQIREAMSYYSTHRDIVDSELREQKEWLQARGYAVDPPSLLR